MGLFIRQNENRSQFQEKLAAELRERAQQQTGGGQPDQNAGSNYLKDTEQTSRGLGIGLFLIGSAVVIAVLYFVFR